ncbi:MAG: AtpZ/AtpI family protein [Actinomycetota bacterium]
MTVSGDGGWSGMGTAWGITGTLVSGMLTWGGVGFLIDRWLDLRWLFLPVGLLVGMGASIYLVYRRHGRDDAS